MEDKIIAFFIIPFFATLILVRIGVYFLHDFDAFDKKGWKGPKKDKSKTPTGWLRRKIKKEIHHFHIGLFIFLVVFLLILIHETNRLFLSLIAVSLSLIIDQPLVFSFYKKNGDYYSKKNLVYSIIMHFLVAGVFLVLYWFSFF